MTEKAAASRWRDVYKRQPAGSGGAASGYAAFFCMGREVLLVAVSGDGGAHPSYFRRILQIHCGEAGGI